jgi:hypothetical protein
LGGKAVPKRYLYVFWIFLAGCGAFYGEGETFYFEGDTKSFELSLGTDQSVFEDELGRPHNTDFAATGFSYWDYCYEQDGNHLHIDRREYTYGCNAIRLYFDPEGKLIDFNRTITLR